MVEVSLDNSMFLSEAGNFSEESYNRPRYYDPSGGRFVSEDVLRFGGGYNFYKYAANNVTDSRDPFGLAPFDGFWPVAGQLAAYYGCANQIKHDFNHFSREA